ncbi:hypothetical protein DAEQUDRAFT_569264 [Daedalea quercina L-15889]|uniref:Uncharacterized protein n=1 Tax=Daedalea quercina L-15889 TaxID=1314783 RepID=A0A165LW12_9APHY|nr:hypothetical protein DAEQUDRAFT_569264 [Daedalea quercina L-15889]
MSTQCAGASTTTNAGGEAARPPMAGHFPRWQAHLSCQSRFHLGVSRRGRAMARECTRRTRRALCDPPREVLLCRRQVHARGSLLDLKRKRNGMGAANTVSMPGLVRRGRAVRAHLQLKPRRENATGVGQAASESCIHYAPARMLRRIGKQSSLQLLCPRPCEPWHVPPPPLSPRSPPSPQAVHCPYGTYTRRQRTVPRPAQGPQGSSRCQWLYCAERVPRSAWRIR